MTNFTYWENVERLYNKLGLKADKVVCGEGSEIDFEAYNDLSVYAQAMEEKNYSIINKIATKFNYILK